ncbi:MAG TPA: BrnT family toxin [Candidatus Sulfotelmatobacter sp.]|nr:BrnT family toxin [Candidatus Sulfotelmatobacter sp.]
MSAGSRLLVVAHSDRQEAIRIISARVATARERKFYEEE